LKSVRVLIVYYSFTQQTRVLLKKFVAGLEGEGVDVVLERLEPLDPYDFPFKTNIKLATAMIRTFFLTRMRVQPVSDTSCSGDWDCVVLAGPTWSYFPSGPILDFLDRYGSEVCGGKKVIPFISCRSYWRVHYWLIKRLLKQLGAKVASPIVFLHPIMEPWRFVGLVLQLRGKMVRKGSWFRKYYPGYGHNRAQGDVAFVKGTQLARDLLQKVTVHRDDEKVPINSEL
jgi:hypothetical protein